MRLEQRTAIVTGGAQGLGFAISELFVPEGARVLMADIQGEKVSGSAARLAAGGAKTVPFTVDVSQKSQVDEMVGVALHELGHVDIIVNTVGGTGAVAQNTIEGVSEELWDEIIGRNLKGTYLCCRAVVPHMKERQYGRIINFSSNLVQGLARPPLTAGAVLPYVSAKAGIEEFTRQLGKQLASDNITVNVVVPGFILTEPGATVRDKYDQQSYEEKAMIDRRSPSGRTGRPDEIANAVLYLASEQASFTNATRLEVAGAA